MSKVVIDLGGGNLRIGKVGQKKARIVFPNYIAKQHGFTFHGNEFEKCKSYTGLKFRSPFERGFLVDCELQDKILNHLISTEQSLKNFDETGTILYVTKPPLMPKVLQEDFVELFFERHEFFGLCLLSSPYCQMYGFGKEAGMQKTTIAKYCSGLVVDSGYSSTTITPIIKHVTQKKGIRRIDVGGKALTNYLQEVLSLRYYDLREETFIVNRIKEEVCYCSLNFKEEMKKSNQNNLLTRYVLPDFVNSRFGYEKKPLEKLDPNDQFIPLKNERISVPELLFHPSDVGLNQCGLAEAIVHSVESVGKGSGKEKEHEGLKALLYDSILLSGGNSLFPNIATRLERELRTLVDQKYKVTIRHASDPVQNAWAGLSTFAQQQHEATKYTVSKQEYEEFGHNLCRERFIL